MMSQHLYLVLSPPNSGILDTHLLFIDPYGTSHIYGKMIWLVLIQNGTGPKDLRLHTIRRKNVIYIYNFHPIHVALNTEHLKRYALLKTHCQYKKMSTTMLTEKHVEPFRNTTHPGTATFFHTLLNSMKTGPSYTIRELGERTKDM